MRCAICLICVSLLSADTPPPQAEFTRAQQLYAKGELAAAEKILRALLPGPDTTPAWAPSVYTTLGVVCHEMGQINEAEYWHLKARALGGHDPAFRAQVLNSLASLYLESGQYGKAERILDELTKKPPPEGNLTARMNANIAGLHMVRGRNREAEALFVTVLDWWNKTGNTRDAAVVLNNLGVLAMDRGDVTTALKRLERSHDLWLQQMGGYHHTFLRTLANYGAVLLTVGRAAEAERMLARARSLAQDSHGTDHEITAQISMVYADALAATGRKDQAKRIRSEASRVGTALRPTVDVLDFAAEKEKK